MGCSREAVVTERSTAEPDEPIDDAILARVSDYLDGALAGADRFFARRTLGDRVPFGALVALALAGLVVIAYVLWSSSTGSLKVDRDKAREPHGSAAVAPP